MSERSKKTVWVFAAASFLNDMGSDMIYPVWPLFVSIVLGAPMTALGLIDGLGEALVSISQAVSGYMSDRIRKRKVFIWTGYLCGSIARVGYAFSSIWQQLIPFKILDRAGKMRGAPRDALIADISTVTERGKNFGILRAMDNLGAVCGIILCILLIERLGYTHLFLLAALPSAVGALLILILIKEKRRQAGQSFKGMRLRDTSWNLRLFFLLSSVFALGSFSYSFLLLIAKDSGAGIGFVPVLYLIFTGSASVSALPFGKLADYFGRKRVIMLSFILWGAVILIFILTRRFISTVLAFILYGLHRGALEPVQKAFVSELAPEEYRASALGGFQMVVGLCNLPASLFAGLLWDTLGVSAPLYLSLSLTIISMALLIFVKDSSE